MMEMIYKVAVATHVIAATIWVGGVLFMALVAIPVARTLEPKMRVRVTSAIGRRFQRVGWASLGWLVLSGSFMMYFWGARWANLTDLSFFQAPHTRVLSLKLGLVTLMLLLSLTHDFFVGPRASQSESAAQAARYRTMAAWQGRITGVLVIVIVILATMVARPWLV
ncbi:copper resistance protein CopD [Lujinxingia vulgaris]|uniref:Copper resistance protein CopD n=1 Tax=Lujinxingia vulgaris TaxID=2600176 RepID=A0A5C6X1V9_9DELT|nr:CopD family protein [Lujinxingia vulgaris]TXD32228.1 copper resistance protein CopD [Lujinxingia vulgaris]